MKLRNKIKWKLRRIMRDLKRPFVFYSNQMRIKNLIFDSNSNIILFGTPNHVNIGDHAIAEAQIQFFNKSFPKTNLVEIDQDLMMDFMRFNKSRIKAVDIITIHGGGNFGNQYMREENLRRSVIEHFPNNKIISLPQTFFYTKNNDGQKELIESKRIINKHSNLVLIAREEVSYELMKKHFPSAKVILTPDIVLSMDKKLPEKRRNGVLMIMRNDDERILKDNQRSSLEQIVNECSDDVTLSDMYYTHNIYTSDERDKMLEFKFDQFRGASLVITDRLHGMVLAAITGTPCIAFSNYNQKVAGTYEWIKDLNYIRFIEFDDGIDRHIQYLLTLEKKDDFSPERFQSRFKQIIDEIEL